MDLPAVANVEFPLFIPPETAPGNYALQFVVYNAETQESLSDSDGQDTTNVTSVHVTEAP
jgi:hypothetical protein